MSSSTTSFCARGPRLPVPSLLSCLGVGTFAFILWTTFGEIEQEQKLEA